MEGRREWTGGMKGGRGCERNLKGRGKGGQRRGGLGREEGG